MENSMEWLGNDVCEGFAANCGIGIDIHDDNISETLSPDMEKEKNVFRKNTGNASVEVADSSLMVIGNMRNKKVDVNGIENSAMCGQDTPNSNGSWDVGHRMQYERFTPEQTYAAADSSMDEISRFKKREQKRRPKPKDGSTLACQICGDRALGYNFDAITCESCKAFFRRNALKTKVFTCSFEGSCKLDQHTRKFCSGCRLKKCLDIGMKKDWILRDDQLAKRRKKTVHSTSSDDTVYPTPTEQTSPVQQHITSPVTYLPPHKIDVYSPHGNSSDGDMNSTNYLSDSTETSNLNSPPVNFQHVPIKTEKREDDFPRPLSREIEAEIEALEKEYASVFDSGYSEDQAKKMIEKPHNANDLFNMTDIFIRRLIKFAKHIPEFKNLRQEDQIYLLKGGIMEIMVLRSAMGFDPVNHKWKMKQAQDPKEHNIDPSIIKEQLGTGMYTEHVQFVKTLHQLTQSNSTIMTLMFVIEIFTPDRPSLTNREAVTQAQEKFSQRLRMFLESLMPLSEARSLYTKLLMKLLDVRNLGESSAKLASHLDITKLEPLLIEVFNLQK